MHRSILITLLSGIFALSGCGSKKETEVAKENKAALFKSGKQNDLNLSYVPGDAILVAVINPQRMLKAPLFAEFSEKELAALAGEGNEFDVRQLTQIVVYSGLPNIAGPSDGGNPGGTIFRFSTAQDPAQLAQQMFGTPEEQDVEGVSAFVRGGGESAIAAIDDKTILVAPLNQLSRMLKAKDSSGPAIDKLRTVPTDNDVVGVFVMNEDLRSTAGFLLGMASQGDGVPAELKDAAKIPANLTSATFLIDFSKEQFLSLAVEMKDQTSASALRDLADKGIDLAKNQLAVGFERMSRGTEMELAEEAKRIATELLGSIEVTQEVNLVIATADMPDNVGDTMMKSYMSIQERSKRTGAEIQISQLAQAVDLYRLQFGVAPASLEELKTGPSNPDLAKNFNPGEIWVDDIPLDPWGNRYVYKYDAQNRDVLIYSLGPNGADEGGAGDDITSGF